MDEWKIVKDRTRCERPGCPLPAADEYWAVLELPACVRRDLCAVCFREVEQAAGQVPLFWRGRRKRDGQRTPAYDLHSLRQLFDRLGEQEHDPAKVETARGLRYLVALLLLRKRVLKIADPATREQEAADLVVIDPKVEGMAPVALCAPELDDARLASLKQELLGVLGE